MELWKLSKDKWQQQSLPDITDAQHPPDDDVKSIQSFALSSSMTVPSIMQHMYTRKVTNLISSSESNLSFRRRADELVWSVFFFIFLISSYFINFFAFVKRRSAEKGFILKKNRGFFGTGLATVLVAHSLTHTRDGLAFCCAYRRSSRRKEKVFISLSDTNIRPILGVCRGQARSSSRRQ